MKANLPHRLRLLFLEMIAAFAHRLFPMRHIWTAQIADAHLLAEQVHLRIRDIGLLLEDPLDGRAAGRAMHA